MLLRDLCNRLFESRMWYHFSISKWSAKKLYLKYMFLGLHGTCERVNLVQKYFNKLNQQDGQRGWQRAILKLNIERKHTYVLTEYGIM